MKICVVQSRPVKGDIESNVENHKNLTALAVSYGADIVVFPELSLTGYEPELARELVTTADDTRFDDFRVMSEASSVTIGVGVPTANSEGICISMIVFQPHTVRQVYSKRFLHADEEAFFVSGQSSVELNGNRSKIALAICYELSVPEHVENACKIGAEIYLVSVAKTVSGIDKAIESLSDIARKYSMTVLMSNAVGQCEGHECAGKTSAWNNKGLLIGQLDGTGEGLLIIDTETQEVVTKQYQ